MKILIIGSKGFIGSHVLQYFSAKEGIICWGCDVVVDYVAERYILLDSTNSDFNEILEEHVFDVCINCSGAASVPDSLQHPFRD
ncbi:MAG TPA: NAD-dependent epimerase/dehydratase family protein, partial [Chitinophagaceae bacterium]|nr:NAD-dependent epimerase/dehydratase family protein [Chitinophagaceae bacterium]